VTGRGGRRELADALAARRDLRHRVSPGLDLAARVDLAAGYTYRSVELKPLQLRSEILRLLERVAARPPQRVLELGTAQGGTLFLFAGAAADGATLVTVDVPGGSFGGGYPRTRVPFLRSLGRPGQRIRLVRGDSHDASTLARVRHALPGGGIDFLFVDGDHRYEGVRRDYELYGRLVRAGGLIAFHDIVPGEAGAVGGVPRLWRELRERHPHEEIVEDWGQGGYGIGVLEVPPA
jgi:predicted O-methyltransferase YrrM